MGGKQKQAQRTKGNVKPSSSARAAELLASSSTGGTSLGFVGFGAMSGDLGYVPAVGGDEVDNSMDADFRMVLRKLSKRDATTKLKALQEFSTLCQEKDVDDIKTVLPFWPRIYNKVAIDHDRRVREATQQALDQLILRVRRSLAPHLKGFMGAWLVAQCDLYAPAASVAKSAFQNAFPPMKQTEVLVFCKDEILTHLSDNLFVHTQQTLSDPKTTEPEDMEAKYHRVLCASLGALKIFLGLLPVGLDQESLFEKYSSFLSNNKFWKYAKHSQAPIVGAFYSVLSAFCQHQPAVMKPFSDKLCPVVLHNLDNTEPLVCPQLWEAVLYVISTVEDCWHFVNPRKGVLPRLWSLLRNGGSGSATVVYPNLMPFLNHIPDDVIGEGLGFYQEFFSNIKTGLREEKVAASPSECSAIIRSFMECIHLCVSRNLNKTELVDCLLQDHFVPILGASILEDTPALSTTPLYPMTVDLLTYLHKFTADSDKVKENKALNQIVQSIKEFRVLESRNPKVLQRYASLLKCFKSPAQHQPPKAKVNFADERSDTSLDANPLTKFQLLQETVEFPLIVVEGVVIHHIWDSCLDAYRASLADKSVPHLVFFSTLFRTYSSEKLAKIIWKENSSVDRILTEILCPWMKALDSVPAKDKGRVRNSFAEIILDVFWLCPVDERKSFMSAAMEGIPSMALFQQFIQSVYKQNTDKSVHAWFKGEEFGRKMVQVAHTLCEQSLRSDVDPSVNETDVDKFQKDQWEMLNLAFSSDDELEPLLGEQYLSDILQVILKALPSPKDIVKLQPEQVQHCVMFVCDVTNNFFSNVKGCLLLPPAEELLISVFQLSCQHRILSDNVGEKVTETWKQGVKVLVNQRGGLLNDGGFFDKVTSGIKFRVQNEADTIDRLQCLIDMSMSLAECVGSCLLALDEDDNTTGHLSHSTVQALLNMLYMPFTHSSTPEWRTSTIVCHTLALDAVSPGIGDSGPMSSIPPCAATVAYTSQLLAALVKDSAAVADDMDSKDPDAIDQALLLDVVYGVVFCEASLPKRQQASSLTSFDSVSDLINKNMLAIFKSLSTSAMKSLLEFAISRSLEDGHLWALCVGKILVNMDKKMLGLDLLDLAGGLDSLSGLTEPRLHTLQILVPYLSKSVLRQMVEIQTAMIMTCTPDSVTKVTGGLGHISLVSRNLSVQDVVLGLPVDPEFSDFSTAHMLSILNVIKSWRNEFDEIFMFDSDVHLEGWHAVSFNVEVMNFFKMLVTKMPSSLSSQAWDFVLCSLVAWVQSCGVCKDALTSDPKTQAFVTATSDLLAETSHCINTIMPEHSAGFPDNLATDWLEFFSEGAYTLLLPLFVKLSADIQSQTPGMGLDIVLRSLSAAVASCPLDHLKKHQLPAKLVADDTSYLPDQLQTMVNHLCPLLLSPSRAVQMGAFRLLLGIVPELSQYDEKQEKEDSLQDQPSRTPLSALYSVLDTASHGLQLLIHDVGMDEPIVVDPHGDEYTITMAYLLSWKLLLAFFRDAKPELKAEYATFLKESGAIDTLLPSLFNLMPVTPIVQLHDVLTTQLPGHRLSNTRSMFAEDPLLDIHGDASSSELQHVACSVYFHSVQDLPAIVRQWYNDQDKKTASIVNRYTSKFASPILCSQEIASVRHSDVQLKNMTIKPRPATKEVVANYTVDEVSIELVISLPQNHPLGPITVECGKRIGVANTQWRNWLLQLTTYLQKQNGTILDGLSLWKRNVDKRFEGVEECVICYSVIHGSNFQVPKLQCKTCKKRFHSACLYKWFNTSNNSSCPMCRNLF